MSEPGRTFFGHELDDLRTAGAGGTAESALLDLLRTHRGELNERMGVEIVAAGTDRLVGTMPVEGNRQPAGLLHGGASAVLAETLGSTHAALLAPPGTQPVGTELSCTHHRSARSGTVTGTCVPLHTGRTMATFEIVLQDEQERRICTARLSCFFLGAG